MPVRPWRPFAGNPALFTEILHGFPGRSLKVSPADMTRRNTVFFAHRHGPLAASVVGVTLIAAGVLLLLERARTEGVARIWPIVLVVLGMGWVDETDDAWWLIGTGSWMLVDMAGAAVARSGAPLLIIAAGLAAFRQAAARTILFPSRERSHAN